MILCMTFYTIVLKIEKEMSDDNDGDIQYKLWHVVIFLINLKTHIYTKHAPTRSFRRYACNIPNSK